MLAGFQAVDDFPRWILPYIDVAALAKGAGARGEIIGGASTPEPAVAGHVAVIVQAAMLMRPADNLRDPGLRDEVSGAARKMMQVAIDDCGNDRPKPWPCPPWHFEILEVATRVAVYAAETRDEVVAGTLGGAVEQLADRARAA